MTDNQPDTDMKKSFFLITCCVILCACVLFMCGGDLFAQSSIAGGSTPQNNSPQAISAIYFFFICCFQFVLFFLPGIAVILFMRPAKNFPAAVMIAAVIVVSCVICYFSFWVYFFNASAGKLFSFLVLAASVVICIVRIKKLYSYCKIPDFGIPLLLILLCGLFYLCSGFLFGGLEIPLKTSAIRYMGPMPVDNLLQYWFAERIYYSKPLIPFTAHWQSSDRPPLQAALFLFQMPLLKSSLLSLHYQIISTIAQAITIAGIFIFLRIARVSKRHTVLVLAACIFSGFFIFNSFYVWPKLFSAGFLFMFSAVLFFVSPEDLKRNNIFYGTMIGMSAALSMLGHGGNIIALVPLAALMLMLKRKLYRPLLMTAAVSFFCLMLPWLLYVKIYDPPGDRIVKIHFAAKQYLEEKSALDAVRKSYAAASFRDIAANKIDNIKALFCKPGEQIKLLQHRHLKEFIREARLIQTVYLFPALGLFNIGFCFFLVIMLRARRKEPLPYVIRFCFTAALTITLFWCLVLFGPGKTTLHHGPYFITPILMTGLILATAKVSEYCAIFVCLANIILSLAIWFPQTIGFLPFEERQTEYAAIDIHMTILTAMTIFGIGVCLYVFGMSRDKT